MKTGQTILLISFTGIFDKHIIQLNEIGDCIRDNNKYGIDYIKEFNNAKNKFVTVSKDQIKRWCGFDTHAMVELTKTGYIKG